MTLLVDNYDSFTFNIFQVVAQMGEKCQVVRNDAICIGQIEQMKPDCILISPGPGTPDEAGLSLQIIESFAGRIPIVGICLGHQAIGQVFGGQVIRAPMPKHGKCSSVKHDGKGSFENMPNPFKVARYHSLIVERESLPDTLEVTCETNDGLVMGLRHKKLSVEGVQFHPESIATEQGARLLQQMLRRRPK